MHTHLSVNAWLTAGRPHMNMNCTMQGMYIVHTPFLIRAFCEHLQLYFEQHMLAPTYMHEYGYTHTYTRTHTLAHTHMYIQTCLGLHATTDCYTRTRKLYTALLYTHTRTHVHRPYTHINTQLPYHARQHTTHIPDVFPLPAPCDVWGTLRELLRFPLLVGAGCTSAPVYDTCFHTCLLVCGSHEPWCTCTKQHWYKWCEQYSLPSEQKQRQWMGCWVGVHPTRAVHVFCIAQ
jgi:hypothetical protein